MNSSGHNTVLHYAIARAIKSSCLCALTKHPAMKAYWGSGGTASSILWSQHKMKVSGQLHAPAALSPGKNLVPIG
jgi:hypothetical protein